MKKRKEVLDIPALQKRGIVGKIRTKESGQESYGNSDGYADLTQNIPQSNSGNALSFLDNLAGTAPSSSSDSFNSSGNENLEVQDLKVKLEDMEYKMNNLIDRLIALESRIGNDNFNKA